MFFITDISVTRNEGTAPCAPDSYIASCDLQACGYLYHTYGTGRSPLRAISELYRQCAETCSELAEDEDNAAITGGESEEA